MAAPDQWVKEQLFRFNLDFDAADTDKSGALSVIELVGVLMKSGFDGTSAEINALFASLDKDGDFKVTRDEFNQVMSTLPFAARREMILRSEFQKLDKDKSGSLRRDELVSCGSPYISQDIILALTQQTYMDADAQINFEEFIRMINFVESVNGLPQVFEAMDKDKSGLLTFEEMVNGIGGQTSLARLRPQVMNVLELYVNDNPGQQVDYRQFVIYWNKQAEMVRQANTRANPYW